MKHCERLWPGHRSPCLIETVPSKWFWSCDFKMKKKHDTVLIDRETTWCVVGTCPLRSSAALVKKRLLWFSCFRVNWRITASSIGWDNVTRFFGFQSTAKKHNISLYILQLYLSCLILYCMLPQHTFISVTGEAPWVCSQLALALYTTCLSSQ